MSETFLSELFGLSGQVAVVIGGSGVLGSAIARGLGRAGAHVVVVGRSEPRGQQFADELIAEGITAEFIGVDIYQPEDLIGLADQAWSQHGRVDILINCAGVNDSTPYESVTPEAWHRVIDGNLTATHLACQAFAPRMAEQEHGGSIVNIGSVTAHLPLSKVFAYSAAKAAVVNLTKNLAREYAPRNVRINVLCPGFFPAEQNRKILTEERVQQIMQGTPMGRFGEAEELVGPVLMMVSRGANSYLTGADLYVDGGFTAMRF